MGKRISVEQGKYIASNYTTSNTLDIAHKLNLNEPTVRAWARRHGLHKQRAGLIQDDNKKEFIINNYLTMTYGEIGSVVGLSADQVEGWVRNHIKDKKNKRRVFNQNYFDEIDTAEKAYWLGFIFADGYIVYNQERRNYEFSIELQRIDRYILCELNNRLGNKHVVSDFHKEILIPGNKNITSSDLSKLRVYSKHLVESLIKHGIELNKSTKDTIPTVRDDLFRDFLRGYIDGDGCVHILNNVLAVHITCASRCALEYVCKKVSELYGINGTIYTECDKKHRLYWFRKEDVKKLLDIIYYDSSLVKLDRKYQKYKSFYGLAV